jgi:hypothetical protein
MAVNRKWTDGMLSTEDWWAVWLGLLMFFAGLLTIWGVDLVGWMTKLHTWEVTNLLADFSWGKLVAPAGEAYKEMPPFVSLLTTYAVFTVLVCIGAYFQRLNVKRFFWGFTAIFFITWSVWIIGHEAHFKALKTTQSVMQSEIYGSDVYCTSKVNTCSKEINKALKDLGVNTVAGQQPDAETATKAVDMAKHAVRLSWGLQLGGGFSYMLALAVGLLIGNLFRGLAGFLREAAKPEWFIKTAR